MSKAVLHRFALKIFNFWYYLAENKSKEKKFVHSLIRKVLYSRSDVPRKIKHPGQMNNLVPYSVQLRNFFLIWIFIKKIKMILSLLC